jgi:hypothetical protein
MVRYLVQFREVIGDRLVKEIDGRLGHNKPTWLLSSEKLLAIA